MKKAVNAANLLLAKMELAKAVIAANKAHGTIKTGRTLASLYERTVGKFAMSRRYKLASVEHGEDYVDLANPAMQEAPPVLSSRAALVAPFQIPDAKKHEPQVGFEIQGEKASDTTNSPDIDFDEFGGWLV